VERHRPVDNAVVLHPLREFVDTVGDRRDLGPHPALRVVHQLVRRLLDEPPPVPVEQLQHAALRDPQGADLGVQVAPGAARRAMVGHDQPPELEVVLVALDDLHGRDAQPLLEDLGRVGGERADRLASDLREMTHVGDEAEELALVEDAPHHAVLGDVRAAPIRVVVQDDVPRLERVDAQLLERPADDEEAGRDLRGTELRLPNHVAAPVEKDT
jgi:hypothetical protein